MTGRLLRTAVSPRAGAQLARLRRSEVALVGPAPAPALVGVFGAHPRAGTSTLAALLAQALAALAPGRVAVLDGDGIQQAQRDRLGCTTLPPAGGLRQLTSAPQAIRSRRVVEQFVAGQVPLLAPLPAERTPIPPPQLDTATRLLRRRFPVVVADAPVHAREWAVATADQVVIVGVPGKELITASRAIRATRRGQHTVTVAAASPPDGLLPREIDVAFPADSTLAPAGTVRLAALALPALAAIEELVSLLLPARL